MAEGKKYDEGKPRWDLLPSSLDEVVYVYTTGAVKYTDRNWEKGMSWGRVFRALITHAFQWWWGEMRHEKGMHHMGSVAWCALALMEWEKTHPEFDDRPYGSTKSPIIGEKMEYCANCQAPFHMGSLMFKDPKNGRFYCHHCRDRP